MNHLQDVYFSNLNAVSNIGGFFSAPTGHIWVCGTHRFEQNKFYLITKGSCTIEIEGESFCGRAGDWFFIPSNTAHSYKNHSGKVFEKYWMHFDIYPNLSLFEVLSLPYVVRFEKNSKACKLFRRYVKLEKSEKLTDRIEVKSILMLLISEYVNLAPSRGCCR